MIDLKRLDEEDIIFLNDKLSERDDFEFSKFLKERKKKTSKKTNKSVTAK